MSVVEANCKVQVQSLNLKPSTPMVKQSWSLIQNWIFTLIADTEKCTRFARLKSVKQMEKIQDQKLSYQESRIHKVITAVSSTLITFH